MKTTQNTVVVAYFIASCSGYSAMLSLSQESKSMLRGLRRLMEVMLRKRLEDLGLKPKKIPLRLMTSPEEITASQAGTSGDRQFFIVPTGYISGSKTMAPFQGTARYATSSACSGVGVQINMSKLSAANPMRRQSFVRQIIDWIIAWYKQEYESQSLNPVPDGHVQRPATPWSKACIVPIPTKRPGGQGRRSKWRNRKAFKSASFA
ncbi:MAG: hypothetical protein RIQ72_660 [Candidatus Parcubacteria bacterium]|jgi:hypothetical protein